MIASRPTQRNCPENDFISPSQFSQLVNVIFAELGPDEALYVREAIIVSIELSNQKRHIDEASEAVVHAP